MLDGALRASRMVGLERIGMIEANVEVRKRQVIEALSSERTTLVSAVSCRGTMVVAKSCSAVNTNGAGSTGALAENLSDLGMRLRRKAAV